MGPENKPHGEKGNMYRQFYTKCELRPSTSVILINYISDIIIY